MYLVGLPALADDSYSTHKNISCFGGHQPCIGIFKQLLTTIIRRRWLISVLMTFHYLINKKPFNLTAHSYLMAPLCRRCPWACMRAVGRELTAPLWHQVGQNHVIHPRMVRMDIEVEETSVKAVVVVYCCMVLPSFMILSFVSYWYYFLRLYSLSTFWRRRRVNILLRCMVARLNPLFN